MGASFGRATRVSVFAAVLIVVMLVGAPAVQLGGKTVKVSPVSNVAAANGNRVFNVGQVDYIGGMATLNPFAYTQAEEMETIWPCYSTLLMYDRDVNIIGDLAQTYTFTPDGLTWHFVLARNAYFVDPRLGTTPAQIAAANKIPSHLVTAADVMFSYWEVNNDSSNHLSSYLNNGGTGIIDSMWTGVDQFDLYIQLKTPYAPFLGSMTMIPIVPLYIWAGKNPITFSNDPPVGSGYFYYGLSGTPTTVGILKRNPIWFQEENRGWQIHIDTLQYKNEGNPDTAWTELTMDPPLIDCMLQVAPSTYKNNIIDSTTPYVMGFAQGTGFVYEYQLNQMSDDERASLGLDTGGASNNQLLLDPTVKLALAMSVNKQQFIDDALLGLGTVADSIISDVNPWHYTYPNPIVFDPVAARALLSAAGWDCDSSGNPAVSDTCPLCKAGGADPLSFRLLSILPDPQFDTGARDIKAWAAQAGVLYTINMMSTNQANTAWYSGDYDAWLWDWAFAPTSDPSTDCLSVHTTGQILVWSGSWWSNKTFDDLYNRSLVTVDHTARKALTDQMQKMLYEDHAAQYVAYRKELYAVNYREWDKASYGHWDVGAGWQLMPDFYEPWLYTQLSPPVTDNMAPTASVNPTFQGIKDGSIAFTGTGSDGSGGTGLQYQWYWGDGTPNTGWLSSASTTHTFTQDGVYTVYFAARETGTTDGFSGWNQTVVTVIDTANAAPTTPTIDYLPSNPNMGNVITFTGSSTDTDPLYYTWDFGDTYTALGPVVTHQYTSNGIFTVSLNVTDNHPGLGRPAHNTASVNVAFNGPPVVSLPATRTVPRSGLRTYTATASDPESDPMLFTWDWGDGSPYSVTTAISTTHTFTQKGFYNVTVYADDQTGLQGHNVSSNLEMVHVTGALSPPAGLQLTAVPTSAFVGQAIQFTGRARDPDAGLDQMRFTFDFGDGNFGVVIGDVPTVANEWMFVNISYAYQALGTGVMTVYMYVSDGASNTTSSPLVITLATNDPPDVVPVSDVSGTVGVATAFSVFAFDPDVDPLLYTWDFGDGSPLISTLTGDTTYVYATSGSWLWYTVYVDDQTGIDGHNVSSSAYANITGVSPPVAVPGPDQNVNEGDLVTLDGSGSYDPDGAVVGWYWNFTYDGVDYNLSGEVTTFIFNTVPGDITVTLWVVDNDGMWGSASALMTVTGNSPPDVTPVSDVSGTVGVAIAFSVAASDLDLDQLIYTWDFGDGSPLTSTLTGDTTYAYAMSGSWIYTVYVDDQTGIPSHNVSSSANAIIVGVSPPVAVPGPDQNVNLGDLVTFDGSGSYDPDGAVVGWYWNFTYDGVDYNLSGESTTFTFDTVPGDITVTLWVVDNDGMWGSATTTVTVAGPIPEFPTMLLPVVGILALVVLFGAVAPTRRRRKS